MADVIRTVYGVYYPETRRVVDALWESRPHGWYEKNYTGKQDTMHRACMQQWRAWVGAAGVKLGTGFAEEYPTAGANEAIHALLAQEAAFKRPRIHVFAGEYEGYTHVASALGLEVVAHPRDRELYRGSISEKARAGDAFWISQPSAIDGNLWPGFGELVSWMPEGAPGVKLVVDLTYVGAVARETPIDLDHEHVAAVIWSLSKPFGVYYHRVGGLVSRAEVPTLRGHHWFKNLFSVHLGERLMAAHPAQELPTRYKRVQEETLARARGAGEVAPEARASDVVVLAHAIAPDDRWKDYARGRGLRFCLSPGMDRSINP
jgi:histidinol-phosphate/aromatic aminotransferase/cobyric acid decarboxylase-like protein